MSKIRTGSLTLVVAIILLGVGGWAFTAVARPVADLQQWQLSRELPQALASHGAVIHDRYLYLVGGRMESGLSSAAVCSAPISSNGAIGECKGQSALPVPLALHAVAASNLHLYVLGGWDEAKKTFHNQVWRAAFASNGGLGYWEEYGNLDDNRALVLHDALVVNNRYLYVIGGQNAQQQIQKKVSYLDLTTAQAKLGNELDWLSGPDLRMPLDKLSAVVKHNVIYVTGGRDGTRTRDEVYYISVDDTGKIKLDEWSIASSKLPEPREYHKAIVFDDKLVILGGKEYVDGGVNDYEFSSMLYASRIENGDPKEWKQLPGLVESLQRFAAVKVNESDADRLYILGGLHGTDYRKMAYQLVAPRPSLSFTVAPENVSGSNDRLVYTISLTSPFSLSNVIISNTIPTNVHVVDTPTYSPGAVKLEQSASQPGEVFIWSLKNNPSSNLDISISYKVELLSPLDPFSTITTVTNEGVGATWTYLGHPGNVKSNSVSAPLPYVPMLTLASQLGKNFNEEEILTYTIHYLNGAYTLTDVLISNTIPASVTVVPGSYVCNDPCMELSVLGRNPNEPIQWKLRDLNPGAHGQISYRVQRMPISTNSNFVFNSGAEIGWRYQKDSGRQSSTPITTTFPYVAHFTLTSEPKGEISQMQSLTYYMRLANGAYRLNNVEVHNVIPMNVTLMSESIQTSLGMAIPQQESNEDHSIHWSVSQVEANNIITMSYRVSRTAEGPIMNEGASISWSFQDEDGHTFPGEAHSNSTRNPPLYAFLPFTSHSVSE